MLTPEQLNDQAELTTDALIELDKEMRVCIVRHLRELESLDATEANRSALSLQNELRAIIRKHDAKIQKAILNDVTATNTLNLYNELKAITSWKSKQ